MSPVETRASSIPIKSLSPRSSLSVDDAIGFGTLLPVHCPRSGSHHSAGRLPRSFISLLFLATLARPQPLYSSFKSHGHLPVCFNSEPPLERVSSRPRFGFVVACALLFFLNCPGTLIRMPEINKC